MAKIIKFNAPASKFGFQRAQRESRVTGKTDQMNLFHAPSAKIMAMPSRLTPFEEALLHDERGEDDAEALYREAIEKEDTAANAYCNLGVIASKRGDTKDAFDHFTNALKLDPRHSESHYNLGNLYFDMGNLDLAKHHYELSITLDPDFPNVYFNLGLVLAMRSELQPAVTALTQYQQLAGVGEAAKASSLLDNLHRSLDAAKKESS